MASTFRNHEEMDAGAQLTFSFFYSVGDSCLPAGATHTQDGASLLSYVCLGMSLQTHLMRLLDDSKSWEGDSRD